MVVFTCNECGEALKKAQVVKHFQSRCRNCNVLSCIDCGKDFWGNDYEQHIKCISEEEKYSGKGYVPKPNANKGEVKQQLWIQQVQAAIDKAQTNPKLKGVLVRMKDYPNIPRAKKKFENFLANSLRVNQYLCAQVWDLLMANTENTKQATTNQLQNSTANGNSETKPSGTCTTDAAATNQNSEQNGTEQTSVPKLNKREKKEERQKQSKKKEKKEKQLTANNTTENSDNENEGKKKKKKKRKIQEEEEATIENAISGKKRKHDESVDEDEFDDNEEEDEMSKEPEKKKFKTKFDWNEVILNVLKSKGEIKIKKIRKKVLAEYLYQGCTEKSEEKLWARFDKKLKKNPAVKIVNDRVKLKS